MTQGENGHRDRGGEIYCGHRETGDIFREKLTYTVPLNDFILNFKI